jgi:dihydropteroate synthase
MKLFRMGVLNVTPNSFSDGGKFFEPSQIESRLNFLDQFDVIDIGAESTAPMNTSLNHSMEWERWKLVLPYLKHLKAVISVDTYHPETIFEILKYFKDEKLSQKLIWNDVSGKFDDYVVEFLKSGHDYIFAHNLSPQRELAGRHMDYVCPELHLEDYFIDKKHPQIIFDPCLGFSKTYEQNWWILENFAHLTKSIGHKRWLLGFSRKSFLRKKYDSLDNEKLDQIHKDELMKAISDYSGELWVRTHRPELI